MLKMKSVCFSGRKFRRIEGHAGPETFTLPADQVFKAIGQRLYDVPECLAREGSKIAKVTGQRNVWAGGDCAAGGEDLTVTAVAEGRDAAEDIHRHLSALG